MVNGTSIYNKQTTRAIKPKRNYKATIVSFQLLEREPLLINKC